ncbi:hypothetical protein A9Q62_06070 [Yersinia ruckeri]|nr:hypothetical protein A9Q62_06070 [Yersinia ruckeri]OJB83423.1 hypothetical protein A9Q60_05835 [Yersinia ruckeri]
MHNALSETFIVIKTGSVALPMFACRKRKYPMMWATDKRVMTSHRKYRFKVNIFAEKRRKTQIILRKKSGYLS